LKTLNDFGYTGYNGYNGYTCESDARDFLLLENKNPQKNL